MKKQYHLNYDCGMAKIKIEVDTNISTTEAAKEILDFYGVFCPRDSWAISTVVKLFGDNLTAIKKHIKENNDLDLLGDKSGIKIIDFRSFQLDEMRLELENIKSIEE